MTHKVFYLALGLLCAVPASAQLDKKVEKKEIIKPVVKPKLQLDLKPVKETAFDKKVVLLRKEMASIDENAKEDLSMKSIDDEIAEFEVPKGKERADRLSLDSKMPLIDSREDLERSPELIAGKDDADLGEWEKFTPPKEPRPPETEIAKFIETLYVEGISIGDAKKFVGKDDKYLLRVLSSPKMIDYHANALTVLSLSGSKEAEAHILRYLRAGKGGLSGAEFSAKTSAIMTLGYLANASEGKAGLSFLQTTAQSGGWDEQDLSWRVGFAREPEATSLLLQRYSLIGLVLSGHPQAAESLSMAASDLAKSDSEWAVTEEELAAFREEYELVSKQGLVAYSDKGERK